MACQHAANALKRKREPNDTASPDADDAGCSEEALVFQQCNPSVVNHLAWTREPVSFSTDLQWLELVNKADALWDNQLLLHLLENRRPGVIRRIEALLRRKGTEDHPKASSRISHPLILCAKSNNVEGVRAILDTRECDVDFTSRSGVSALYISCHYGNEGMVDLLCKAGARSDLAKKNGGTCVYSAVKHGCLGTLEILVRYGADLVSARHKGAYFLHVAAKNGHDHVVRYLLDEHHVDINVKTSSLTTAVQIAIAQEKLKVVRVLLERNCALLQDLQSVERSEIHMAARSGNLELLEILCTHLRNRTDVPHNWINLCTEDCGATPFLAAVDGGACTQFLQYLHANGANERARRDGGYSAIVMATKRRRSFLIPFLVRLCGMELLRDVTDAGYGVVEMACRQKNYHAVVTLLRIDPDLLQSRKSPHSALYFAAKGNCLDIVKLLVENYAVDVNAQDAGETPPIQVACKAGHVEIVKYLLEHGACLDAHGHKNIAFISACNHGRLSVVKYLVERKGCEIVLTRGGAGWTGIHVASRSGNMELLRFLCEKLKGHEDVSSLVEIGGGYSALHVGVTPCILAAYHGQVEAVRYLCAVVGMDVGTLSLGKEHTAYYLAKRRGQKQVQTWLKKAKRWNSLELSVEARNPAEVFRLLHEGHAGRDPFRLFVRNGVQARENALDIARRGPEDDEAPGPWLPVCKKTLHIVELGIRPWCPENHELYPPSVRHEWYICAMFADRRDVDEFEK